MGSCRLASARPPRYSRATVGDVQEGGEHYLNDFITVGPPGSRECRDNLDRILTVLRWMMDLLRTPSATKPHHHIRLNHRTFRADLQWWETFAVHWNGVAMFPCVSEPTVSVTSDASGAWGCGAWSGSSCSRVCRRLLFGAGSGGGGFSAVTRRSCRDTGMMHLVRCLFFLEAGYDFAAHPPGRDNMLADDLFAFVSKVRSPDPQPVPPELLLDPTGWTSPRWTRRFCAIA